VDGSGVIEVIDFETFLRSASIEITQQPNDANVG
jgi:hypothetical protein